MYSTRRVKPRPKLGVGGNTLTDCMISCSAVLGPCVLLKVRDTSIHRHAEESRSASVRHAAEVEGCVSLIIMVQNEEVYKAFPTLLGFAAVAETACSLAPRGLASCCVEWRIGQPYFHVEPGCTPFIFSLFAPRSIFIVVAREHDTGPIHLILAIILPESIICTRSANDRPAPKVWRVRSCIDGWTFLFPLHPPDVDMQASHGMP